MFDFTYRVHFRLKSCARRRPLRTPYGGQLLRLYESIRQQMNARCESVLVHERRQSYARQLLLCYRGYIGY